MILGTLDEFDDDSEMPFRTRVGRRQAPSRAPVRETVALEPEPMGALDRAVMCNAFGGIWLTLLPGDVDELAALVAVGVIQIHYSAGFYQLTPKGAREMGLLPAGE